MRKTFFLVSITFLSFQLIIGQQNTGVKFFEGSLPDALKKAAQENKLLFVDCHFEGCGPCLVLDKEIFPQKESGDFFNKEFISYRIDVYKEYGKSIEIENRYQTGPYPTLLFLDTNGKEVFKKIGCISVEEFVESGRNALEFLRLAGNIDSVKTAIATGKTLPRQMFAFMIYLVNNASVMMVESDGEKEKNLALIHNYFKSQSFQDLFDISNMSSIFLAAEYLNVASREYNFMLMYRNLFYQNFNAEAVNKKLLIVGHTNNLTQLNRTLATAILSALGQATVDMGAGFINYSRYPKKGVKTSIGFPTYPGVPFLHLSYYKSLNERDMYEKFAGNVAFYQKNNTQLISDLVLTLHEDKIASRGIYEMCLPGFKVLDKTSETYPYFLTAYGVCLFHLSKIEDSKKTLEKAIAVGRTNNQDTGYAEALLTEIKNR